MDIDSEGRFSDSDELVDLLVTLHSAIRFMFNSTEHGIDPSFTTVLCKPFFCLCGLLL